MDSKTNSEQSGKEESQINGADAERNEEASDGQRLEDVLLEVEKCILQLENPQISLEDSFRYYEEGVRKLKLCNEKVAQIEQKMLVIGAQGELEEF